MEAGQSGMRWTRAATVATAATLVAVGAHLGAGGPAPTLPVLAFLVLGLAGLLAPFLARQVSPAGIVMLTVGGQFLAHATLARATGHAMASANADLPAGQHDGGGTAAEGTIATAFSLLVASDARMMLAHLTAAVVVGVWLAAGERSLWTVVRLVWRRLALPVQPPTTTLPPPVAIPARTAAPVLLRLEAGSLVRRGPPHLLAA